MVTKTALIFGITGMDGSYLADHLLEEGYQVYGCKRRTSTGSTKRIKHLESNPMFSVVEGDITDYASIINVFNSIGHVDEVYNLAAQSHVGTSFKQPGLTWDVTGKGCMNILQAIVDLNLIKSVRFYQASSSEMFGSSYTAVYKDNTKSNKDILETNLIKEVGDDLSFVDRCYQDENTKFLPQSPYAIAKCAAHMSVRLYRNAYNLHGSCGILFNHEGARRGENFVTRKITKWIGDFIAWQKKTLPNYGKGLCIVKDTKDYIHYCIDEENRKWAAYPKLRLGNLDAKRDWGHAKDYVKAMHLMVQQDKPDDYVVCTGETYSVREFLKVAFKSALEDNYEPYVVIDPEFYRPAEVDFLLGNSSKANNVLGWTPEHSFEQLVEEMVQNDTNEAHERF